MKLVNNQGQPRFNRGQTLVEVMVVTTVGILVIGALVFATISSLRNSQFSKNQAQTTKLAQEGLERLRSARDHGDPIGGNLSIGGAAIDSWKPESNLWTHKMSDACSPSTTPPTNCYFKFNGLSFQFITSATDIPSSAEDPLGDGKFKRVIILSDDPVTYQDRKNVTVIVRWSDFSGNHESRLTSILRKL